MERERTGGQLDELDQLEVSDECGRTIACLVS